MSNPILDAITMLLPQNKRGNFVSPLPEGNVLDTSQKLQAAKPSAANAIQAAAIERVRQAHPNLPVSDSQIAQWYTQFGNRLFQGVNTAKGDIQGAISSAVSSLNPVAAHASDQFNPNQKITPGINSAMNYIKSQTPGGQDPMKYYKAFQDPNFLPKIQAADSMRPGLSNLLLLQGFHESTLGNASPNIFGVLPGGEGSGQTAGFTNPSDAIDYQLSPNVMGGGANPNMNLLSEKTPLTIGRVQQFYKSYNPEGAYVNDIMSALSK